MFYGNAGSAADLPRRGFASPGMKNTRDPSVVACLFGGALFEQGFG